MIASKKISYTNLTWAPWGQIFLVNISNCGNFIVPFIAVPNVQITPCGGWSFWIGRQDVSSSPSITTWGGFNFYRPTNGGSDFIGEIQLLAIGRWK